MTTRVMSVGLGPIGAAVARQLVRRPGFKLVAAVDVDPAKAGRDAGEVIGGNGKLRVKVEADVVKALRVAKPDVAVLCTSSSLAKVVPQIEAVLKAKVPIVSSTEELAYPWRSNRRWAKRVDA